VFTQVAVQSQLTVVEQIITGIRVLANVFTRVVVIVLNLLEVVGQVIIGITTVVRVNRKIIVAHRPLGVVIITTGILTPVLVKKVVMSLLGVVA
jgi:hypothetical protein